MNRKILIVLVVLFFVSGCGRKEPPELERFTGKTVATLQTPSSQPDQAFVSEGTLTLPSSAETPQPTQFIPTLTPAAGMGMTATVAQPTQQPYAVETTKPAPLASATTVSTLTPTSTLGVPVWEGTWNIWYQNISGNYSSSVMNVEINGTQFSATAVINNFNYTFTGNIIMQGSEIEGEWESPENDGQFWFQMISSNAFVGSRDARFGFCGDREASTRPAFCRKTP